MAERCEGTFSSSSQGTREGTRTCRLAECPVREGARGMGGRASWAGQLGRREASCKHTDGKETMKGECMVVTESCAGVLAAWYVCEVNSMVGLVFF